MQVAYQECRENNLPAALNLLARTREQFRVAESVDVPELPPVEILSSPGEQVQRGGEVVLPAFLVGDLHRPPVLLSRQPLLRVLRDPLGLRLPVPRLHRLLVEP